MFLPSQSFGPNEFLLHRLVIIGPNEFFFELLCICSELIMIIAASFQVRELAEKEPENGVFRMLRADVTRFLTTILIGTTYD